MEKIMITDWLMVIITCVYVVATIFICKANIKSAEATKEQLEESKRQFEASQKQAKAELEETKRQFEVQLQQFKETLRPYIVCEYKLINRCMCCIRITNCGNRPAFTTKFNINDDFVDSLHSPYKKAFTDLNNSASYAFGINQYYDFYFGEVSVFKKNIKDFKLKVEYDWDKQHYTNEYVIEFTKYLPIFSADEFEDKILKEINSISTAINKLSSKGENNV